MGRYDNIIHLDRPEDPNHPPMSIHNRAAQFAPFDALTGFGGQIQETSRLTKERMDLSEEVRQTINDGLRQIEMHIHEHPTATIRYYLADQKKSGGSYPTVTAQVLKIDTYKELLHLESGLCIPFEDIAEISIQRSPLPE